MKKIVLIVSFVFLLTSNSFGVTDAEFVAAKGKLLYAYSALESNALQITLMFEQNSKSMSAQEQTVYHMLRADLELGVFVIKDILGLYTLQSAQESTPPEAAKLLINASLDTTASIDTLMERLSLRGGVLSSDDAKKVISGSFNILSEAKKDVKILQSAMDNIINLTETGMTREKAKGRR